MADSRKSLLSTVLHLLAERPGAAGEAAGAAAEPARAPDPAAPDRKPDPAPDVRRAGDELPAAIKNFDKVPEQALGAFALFNPEPPPVDEGLHSALVARAVELGYVSWPKKIRGHVHGKRVLDVGCGAGIHAIGYVIVGAKRYVGIDPRLDLQQAAVQSKRTHAMEPFGFTPADIMRAYRHVALLPGSFEDIAPEETFDIAVLHNVTEHLIRIEEVLAGVARRLAPGGRLLFHHHNFYCWNGHHSQPRTVAEIDLDQPKQRALVDWAHLDFVPPPGHYICTGLNRVRLDELKAMVLRHFDIKDWTETPSDAARGAGRLTPEIRARHPGFSERELTTQNVFCVASVKRPKPSQRDMLRDEAFRRAHDLCQPYTMTSMERLYAVWQAVGHIVRNGIPGALVECGVWRGGSSMMAALALRHFGDDGRRLWLYDTFAGMPEPGPEDVKFEGGDAASKWGELASGDHNAWNFAPLDEVRSNLVRTGLPADRFVCVQGRVEETLPGQAPERLALLRLDTDFYASTRAELKHLYPRLAPGGVLIVDDYGSWQGSRQAVEEYFSTRGAIPLLARTDAGGRIGVKPGAAG
ncbi:MAG TPA: TylF/MycF/NovP-related O-methyltransferase [Geminicoccaceae bacterium]|nr:TylF/MycF/NovP-related O-methyltransferase [Geminicoccaceae bacterium]